MNWDNATAAVARALDERDTTWHLGGPIKKFVEGAKWQRADLRTDEAIERVAVTLLNNDWPSDEGDREYHWKHFADSYREEARAAIDALFGEKSCAI